MNDNQWLSVTQVTMAFLTRGLCRVNQHIVIAKVRPHPERVVAPVDLSLSSLFKCTNMKNKMYTSVRCGFVFVH